MTNFRTDNQGLLAIAALFVVMLFCYYRQPLPFGFTIIDVFFVISVLLAILMFLRQKEKTDLYLMQTLFNNP